MKVYLSAALFLAASALGAQLTLPGAAPKPEARVTKFTLETLTLRDVTFAIEVTVKNPYPVNLTFNGLSLDFAVEGQKVLSTKTKGSVSIPGNKEKAEVFLATLDFAAIINLVKTYTQKDWLQTKITGTLTLPLPKMPGLPPEITFTYNLEKKIPAIKPQVSLLNFTVKAPDAAAVGKALKSAASSVDPAKAAGYFADLVAGKPAGKPVVDPASLDVPFTLSFTLALENSAKAPLQFPALDYDLQIDGVNLLKGAATKVQVQGPKTLVTIDTTFSSKNLGEVLKKTFQKRSGQFRIQGKAQVTLPKEIRDTPVPLSFDEKGSFKF